jgi:hypothetical protein
LRQIGFFIENELAVSDAGEVYDVRMAEVLKIRGLESDISPVARKGIERR